MPCPSEVTRNSPPSGMPKEDTGEIFYCPGSRQKTKNRWFNRFLRYSGTREEEIGAGGAARDSRTALWETGRRNRC